MPNPERFSPDDPIEKKGLLARFKAFVAGKFEKKPTETDDFFAKTHGGTTSAHESGDIKKFNEFLGNIEAQLERVDEQNRSLLEQLSLLKSNNETLISQVCILTDNNNHLTEQFNKSRKREKIAKILAIISSVAALGLTAWKIIGMLVG